MDLKRGKYCKMLLQANLLGLGLLPVATLLETRQNRLPGLGPVYHCVCTGAAVGVDPSL
jgi:hypothetical protein